MTTIEETPTIVPNFDDDDTDRKICFICSKGSLDMAYPALVMANAALGEGIETHIFFTFWGLDMIHEKTVDNLKFTILGNTASHMPQALGGIPGMTAMATHMMKKQMHEIDIPDVREFLRLISDAGGHLWACKMSVDMMHLDSTDFVADVEDVITATDFIELSQGAQVIFV